MTDTKPDNPSGNAPPPAAPNPQPDSKTPPAPRKNKLKLPLLLIAAALVAFFIWRGFFAKPAVPENLVVLSGRIEGDDSAVASKVTGRILEIRVREGDTVKMGD